MVSVSAVVFGDIARAIADERASAVMPAQAGIQIYIPGSRLRGSDGSFPLVPWLP